MQHGHMHDNRATEFIEHLYAATPPPLHVNNVACLEITELENSFRRSAQVGDVTDIASIDEELLLEQFDTFKKLLALLVDYIMQDCMLQMAKHVKCAIFDVAMLSLTNEARQQFTQPLHAIDDVMHVVHIGFEVVVQLCVQ